MAPLSLKIILDDGAVTKTLMFDTTTKVYEAHDIVREKILTLDPDKDYGFFLTSADNDNSGIWLSNDKKLEYYMLKDGDSVLYLTKMRNLRLRMLDGHVKMLQVDESKIIEHLLVFICQKIGVANHEEYGLCREDLEPVEETKPNVGTLTLKRNTKVKEKDVQLEQLRKKLKTDDNVEWLDQMKTLRECKVDPNETLLFKRRLFYSDRNVDSRDPVQLNLLYVQTRDAILDGRQVVTVDKAVEFAGIQCQIQYGDFLEEKHKPGFIENLKEFLPEQYASSWGVERKINTIHSKYNGLSQIEAKHLYIKSARELPTYGVTFFLVKEKHKGKKKLIPRLLGINSESVLRLDQETKEILQVWPLTQIKSYKAGSESFTLNFGDYSDKEYAVKTNDAMRIRDILQGYIDIIRKRLAAPFNVTYTEGEAICEETVESSRGNWTQNVVASKVNEYSLVGPSQIIAVEQGLQSQQGTKIMSVHEIITTTRLDKSQQPMRGELRSSVKYEFRKKLNRLNSEAVKAVMFLSDPTNANIQEVRRIVAGFEEMLPSIMKGVNETAASLSEEDSKKLLDELDELCAYINKLSSITKRSDLHEPDNLMAAQDAATKVAELSTQMCFSLDPKTKRRSKILSRTRQSFILDDKTEASLRRASFLTAADTACQAVEQAQSELDLAPHDISVINVDVKDLERKTVDRLGKLNAAIALLLNAHADSKSIDYEMAINSMQTINKIIPDLIKDARLLTSIGDEDTKRKLRGQIAQLLNGTRAMCMLTGTDDTSKMQDTGNEYADVSKKLIFTFSRPTSPKPDNAFCNLEKENEIMNLAKDVGEKASILLMHANELTNFDPDDPHATELDTAGVKCAEATEGLLSCAKLTAPSILEPHCQSALTAAAENLSTKVQALNLASKPLVEKPGRHGFASQLADRSFDLAKALDRLKNAYANLSGYNIEPSEDSESERQGRERLKFIMSKNNPKHSLLNAEEKLKELNNLPVIMDTDEAKPRNIEAKRLLSQKLAQLNGAIAALLQSTSDPENSDYETAGAALKTICKLTPSIIDETKALHGSVEENAWNDIMANLRNMLEATQEVCANADNGDVKELKEAASKLASSSGKLTFVFNPRSKAKKNCQVIDLSKAAVEETFQLLSKTDKLSQVVGGDRSIILRNEGVKVRGAAQHLLKTSEVVSPSIEQARCKAALLYATKRLSDQTLSLQSSWKPITEKPEYLYDGEQLDQNLDRVQTAIDKVRAIAQLDKGSMRTQDEVKRLQFIATLSSAKNAMTEADTELNNANSTPLVVNSNNATLTKELLSKKLAHLNAAIADLLLATSDHENPDYEAATASVTAISNLTPAAIKDAIALQGTLDDKSWNDIIDSLKSMVEATYDICANADDPQELNDAALKLGDSARKLTYTFHPNRNVTTGNKILDLSKTAVKDTSVLLSNVYDLGQQVGEDEDEILETKGIKVVDSARALLKIAEITSPTIGEADCQKSLLSAIDCLSSHAIDLKNSWKPIVKGPKYIRIGEQLEDNMKQIQFDLNQLKELCQAIPGVKMGNLIEEQEKRRLQFIQTLSMAKNAMTNANKELEGANKISKSRTEDITRAPAVRNALLQNLARLNTALSTLLQATSDRENPDYKEAMGAINYISNATPDIIKDAKFLHGSANDETWKEVLENLKSMVNATSDLCANADDSEEFKDSASEVAKSVDRLTYLFNPRRDVTKENQIKELSKNAVQDASVMLSHVYQLTENVGEKEGEQLDNAGVKVVDSAQMLLKIAEITAPTMDYPHCQDTFLCAIDHLSGRSLDLQDIWKPLAKSPQHIQYTQQLDQNQKQFHKTLDELKKACRSFSENQCNNETQEQKMRRLQFVDTLSSTKNAMSEANKELDKVNSIPTNTQKTTVDKTIIAATNNLLSQKLAQLNAAIASLLQATSDQESPDYVTAAEAMNVISSLTPDIIKDTKTLHGTVDDKSWSNILESLKSIVDTTNDICSDTENPEKVKESALKFANSAGRLTYVFNPPRNIKEKNRILDLSKRAIEETSVLLSKVNKLTGEIGGDEGEKLDASGVKVVDSAQMLLKTAEITAPTIENIHCQETLSTAIDRLFRDALQLQNHWKPLDKAPQYHQTVQQLDQNLNQVHSTLHKLREACHNISGKKETQEQEKQRLHLISTLSTAKNAMMEANSELKEINSIPLNRMSKRLDKSKVPATKKLLSDKLAQLNAAIADLLQTTSDPDQTNYEAAAAAINTISKLTPALIKETKSLHGTMDEKSWSNIMESLNSMIASTNELCDDSENPQKLKESASKFANSVGRLTYVFNPNRNLKQENQILDLSKRAIEETSLLLSKVNKLTGEVGGDEGEKLDASGVKVVDSAQMLLKTAEITAPTLKNIECQETLLSAIDRLSERALDLQNHWKPLSKTPQYHQTIQQLDQNLNQVHSTLDNLREACRNINGKKETQEQEKQRLHFISTLSTAKNAMMEANNELKEVNNIPLNRMSKQLDMSRVSATKKLLSDKLALLNAAIADLLQTTSDPDQTNYVAAAAAMNTISRLTPALIKETKSLHGTMDEKSWSNIMESLNSMIASTNELCDDSENPQKLKESASKFANSVGRLTYVFNPHRNLKKENQILDLSKRAIEETSLLLSKVNKLTGEVGGDEGEKLDASGVKVVDSAQMLLKTAEITAPTLKNIECQETLLSAIDRLSERALELQNHWKPLSKTPQYHQTAQQLDQNLNQVHSTLGNLREACKSINGNETDKETQEQEKQRLHFIATLSTANNAMKEANQKLKETNRTAINIMSKPMDKNNVPATKKLLSHKLAQLNAAIADLLQATSDQDKPDYEAAAEALNSISDLTPAVISETKALHGIMDDQSWSKIMENLNDMVLSTNGICASIENTQDLKDYATKSSHSIGRLRYIFKPHQNVKKENKILELSKNAVEDTSVLLSNVYQLTERVGGEEGAKLDMAGVKVVDSAQILLKTAEITASSMEDPNCKKSLFAAIDHLTDKAQDLQNTWKPILYAPQYRQSEKQLENNLEKIKSTLDTLRLTCMECDDEKNEEEEKQRLQFVATLSTAKDAVKEANNELKQIESIPANDRTSKTFDKKHIYNTKRLLSTKLAQLNAAIASLLQSTSDRENPNYDAAAKAVNTISNLTPQIVKDTKTLHGSIEAKSWNTLLGNLKTMVATTNDICTKAEDPQELKEITTKFANSAGQLTNVFNPHHNVKKENLVRDLSRCAVEQTSLLLSNVYQLTEKVGGEEGEKLDATGIKVVESANMLLKTAELTSANISDSHCQAALLSSVDQIHNNAEDLRTVWKPLVLIPQYQSTGDQLEQNIKIVYATLEKLRKACQDTDDSKDCKPDHLLQNISEAQNRLKEAEKLFSEEKIAERAMEASSQTAKSSDKPVLEQRVQISNKLAKMNESIAQLVQAMLDREAPDYKRAEQSISVISKLTPEVIQETLTLQRNLDDNSRAIVFSETKTTCEAIQEICSSVENNSLQDLNVAATKYAQSSGKLRYIISPRSYPNKEKKILDASRSACERTSLMLSRVSRLAESSGADDGERMSIAGARVADAAHALFTNAQIISPSIEDRNCQSTLSSSADRVTNLAQNLEKIWNPIILNPQHHQIGEQLSRDISLLNSELDRLKEICQDNSDYVDPAQIQQQPISKTSHKPLPNPKPIMDDLDNILQNIQKNVAGDSKKPKVPERILIEDTPLRKLASKIMDSAKIKSSNASSPKDRDKLSQLANELSAAIHKLDIANAKSRDASYDAKDKAELAFELENAVLNLQFLCIKSRQPDAEQSTIVDLTDFVKDVTSAVDELDNEAEGIKEQHGKVVLMAVKDKCLKIRNDADELMKPQNEEEGNMFDHMVRTGQFAKDCDIHIKEITAAINQIKDDTSKKNLLYKLQSLADKCNLMSFAAQSSISNGKSAALEGSLQNLGEVEKRIEVILKPIEEFDILGGTKENVQAIQSAQSSLAAVVASGDENQLPAAITRYAVNMRGVTTNKKNYKLKDHLDRLLGILKMQIGDKNRRVLTWQDDTEEEKSKITDKILEELQSFAYEVKMSEMPGVKTSDAIKQSQVIKDVDLKRLLVPSGTYEIGNEKELTSKLNQQMQKLNSIACMIPLSLNKPESLSKSLHSTTEVAIQLASVARGLKHQDPVKNKRIEEAAQEISVATYNLLKTAESVSHSTNKPESRRRLMDALRSLNDSLNNMAKTTSPRNTIQRDCNEMARILQLQHSFLSSDYPSCALNYADCVNALQNQQEVIDKLRSEQAMSQTEYSTELRYVTSAICNTVEYASHSAYLLSLSNTNQNVAKEGMVDVPRIKKLTESMNETCLQIICNDSGKEVTEQVIVLDNQMHQLEEAIEVAETKIKEDEKKELSKYKYKLLDALKGLNTMLKSRNYKDEQVMPTTIKVIDELNNINDTVDRILQPRPDKDLKKTAMSKEVIDSTKNLVTTTATMIKKASSSEVEKMTWTMFGSIDVIKSFEILLTCIREKGAEAGYTKPIEKNVPQKSFVQTQVDLACVWLKKPAAKENDKAAGIAAVEKIMQMADQMCDDLQGSDKEELKHVTYETKQLLKDCSVKYNSEKASLLMDRLKELRKMLERGVVTRVVEDFLEEEPLANLEALHEVHDEKKRKFLLEKKIAELLAQLGRITKTAKFVADTAVVPRQNLIKTSDQAELLAPALVKAAEERIHRPDDKAAIEHYQQLLAQYAESLSKVRYICDRAVDPIDFSQAAGETMQRIKEESSNDPHKSVQNSEKIMKLCNRVIEVSMDSEYVRADPELKKTLVDIKRAVDDKCDTKKANKADWTEVTAEFMRRTGEVESVLGGENIFLKQPEPNQPIYAAALDLHAAVRDWSARDNEIVAVAKRMAVQMARLSDYMNNGKSRELIFTSNTIISQSKEVAALAKKLALECSDIRIRTNLLQVCDRIPTISGQLKMLTTVKGSSLGHQDSAEDKEAMTMLVDNAQNLMKSIQEVVKAAASASVKIMSQKGYRMKWKRRNYY